MTVISVGTILAWGAFVVLFGVLLLGRRGADQLLLALSGGVNLMAGSLAGGMMNNPEAWPWLVVGLLLIQLGLVIVWRLEGSRQRETVNQAVAGIGTTAAYTAVFILLFFRS